MFQTLKHIVSHSTQANGARNVEHVTVLTEAKVLGQGARMKQKTKRVQILSHVPQALPLTQDQE